MPRGAPRGNLNALKHGRTSPRVRALLHLLLALPELRQLLLSLWARALEGSPRQRQRYLRTLARRLDDVAAQNKSHLRALLYEARQENSENKYNSLAAFQARRKAAQRHPRLAPP